MTTAHIRLLGIAAVTLAVPDLRAATLAYQRGFGYVPVDEGRVSPSLAAAWDAPLAAGSRWRTLRAPPEQDCVLRLVERPSAAGYRALRHHGWNANELLCADPAAVVADIEVASFRLVGPPAPLDSNPKIFAAQVIGPAGELVYLTRIPPEGGSIIKTPPRARVDRTFIVVVGGASMSAMQGFYRDLLGLTVTEAFLSPVGVLNAAHGLPPRALTPLSLAAISDSFCLELDEYPATAAPCPRPPGDLAPGIALVSFYAADLDAATPDARPLPWRVAPATRPAGDIGAGCRAGIVEGAAGERLELIERATLRASR